MSKQHLLNNIDSPSQLRKLPEDQLETLAQELRQHMLESLNKCGGHFGANLGSVELAIALHYVFNTPEDRLVWDVGHQAYPHKILTGRRDQLHTIKQPDGLAPFPKREESEYDTFGVGHSSTSISAALGMAIAAKRDGIDRKSVAIIGDGGLTGGMALEALNHAGDLDVDLLVILNDNDMSISPNLGGLNKYFTRILTSKTYINMREGSKKVLSKMPPMWEFAKRTEAHMKGMVAPGMLFEELGLNYFGPIDGHDVELLVKTLKNLRDLTGPRLLHIRTIKGKGYKPAEEDQVKYHAVKPGFLNAKKAPTQKTKPTYSQIFGDWLCDIAASDKRLMAVTPAMREGSGMVRFAEAFPQQYFDVCIAEQHAVTFAAGLACEGKKPVVAIYSTFLQRAYDQLIHDVALQKLDVTFALDRAGLVGADGPTHAGSFDLSYLRCIPNMVVMAPSDENECRQMLYTAYEFPGPAAVRYPRGTGSGVSVDKKMHALPIGKAERRRQGKNIAILAFGSMLSAALTAGEQLDATVINMRFVKPIDETMILSIAKTHAFIITVEENAKQGGAGSAINEVLANHGVKILNLGLPDQFIEHGNPEQMLAACGLDSTGIANAITQFVELKAAEPA